MFTIPGTDNTASASHFFLVSLRLPPCLITHFNYSQKRTQVPGKGWKRDVDLYEYQKNIQTDLFWVYLDWK